jgi:dihydrofolate synthase/folylpolyglutamate synthase
MTYQKTIAYLFGLQKHGIKFGLTNSRTLMGLMGNPHRAFRAIHVAGTNGKGSTSLFIAAMLRAAGHRVGLYTSPHLVSFTERIRINNVPIAEERVVELAGRVRERSQGVPGEDGSPINPTFFEVTTAVAFTYFAEEGVDVAVIEVGMGGRLDSTNVITPLVSVITNIDLEHTEFLGQTIEEIAAEKAGIIKPGVSVVTGASQPEAVRVIAARAEDNCSPLFRLAKDFHPENISRGRDQVFDYRGIASSHQNLRITMLGRHQIDNACLAVAAVECLRGAGIEISDTALRSGLGQAAWEGRLERVAQRPDIYLDGAHNPAAARALAASLKELRPSYGKLILVIGILADKDVKGVLSELLPLADHVVVTKPQYSRAMDVALLAERVKGLHGSVSATESVEQAVVRARQLASEDDLVVITGSLYVVGDARAAILGSADRTSGLAGLKG